jgi:hypothetical protein
MNEFHVRIGKIRSRGGASVHVLDTRPPYNCDVLARLSTFVELARAGKIDGIGIAATRWDGAIMTTYVISRSLFSLVGAVKALEVRMDKEFDT